MKKKYVYDHEVSGIYPSSGILKKYSVSESGSVLVLK
jgi:hypothetical protein